VPDLRCLSIIDENEARLAEFEAKWKMGIHQLRNSGGVTERASPRSLATRKKSEESFIPPALNRFTIMFEEPMPIRYTCTVYTKFEILPILDSNLILSTTTL